MNKIYKTANNKTRRLKLNSFDLYVWGILDNILKPTATLFGVSTGWVLLFYGGITILTYLRLKGENK